MTGIVESEIIAVPIVEVVQTTLIESVEISKQGPPGPSVPAFLIALRFSELDTPDARVAARANLELDHIDCGEFL